VKDRAQGSTEFGAYNCPFGAIAQLEERDPCTVEVAGSSPAGSISP
jgi:hypothetical protein